MSSSPEKCVKCGICEMVCPSELSALRALDEDRAGKHNDEVANCTTCNRCVASCPAGVSITKAIERMRDQMLTPGYRETLANISTYGASIVPAQPMAVEMKSRRVAYFAGCLTNYRLPDIAGAIGYTLDYLGIEFTRIPEVCCGSPLNRIGRFDLAKTMLEKNLGVMRSLGVETVVTSCPGCTSTLMEYQDDFDVVHYLDLYDRYGLSRELSKSDKKATMQYPCHLYRNVSPYTMVAAERLMAAMYDYRRLPDPDRCCGAGGGVRRNDVSLSRRLRAKRVDEVRALAADEVVTTCPQCRIHLSEALPGVGELSVLIARNLGYR
ncbi:MAG: CoB--CoM heterodisulfide reductase iron-sulfur subunit D [Methanocella sp. PtaU1.Bin125]|nr:MAG: CoB--CoM heterodisulfide reductase iron-sulfur subunit D [Methanocella sp. PtaU1.Bin125]